MLQLVAYTSHEMLCLIRVPHPLLPYIPMSVLTLVKAKVNLRPSHLTSPLHTDHDGACTVDDTAMVADSSSR
jgi:hypothetical protein